ncbi:MAG TPA: sugar phosphate isomerase/epimerase [Armatimonadota bacterium]|jgi:sugar phosphate isomerase/epimerase
MKPIAVQLYSLRDEAVKDFPGLLKRVAEIGYKGVETAGLHGHDPKEIGKIVKDLGMEVCSSHAAFPTDENIEQIVDTEKAVGNTVVIAQTDMKKLTSIDECKAEASKYARAAELLKARGMTFGVHNHWWEFNDLGGICPYDILLGEVPAMFSELDVYWSTYAKLNSPELVSKYKSRIPFLHLKDGMLEEGGAMTALGEGKVPITEIVQAADPNTLKWLVVELDRCDTDVFEAVKKSYAYLTSRGLGAGNK